MRVCDTISLPIAITTTHERMVYEGGNIVKVEEESGKWVHSFTYENGLLVKYLTINEGDSAILGTVSYNADNLAEEIMYHDGTKTTKWNLTWVDGDATQVVQEILEPGQRPIDFHRVGERLHVLPLHRADCGIRISRQSDK